MYKKLLFLVLVLSSSFSLFSQYNYNAGFPVVYNILNTKCQNAGCHSSQSASSLRFDTTSAAVYAEIFNQPPINSNALGRGEQLVWMSQPYQSYLLKKAGNWFDTDLGLPAGEPDSAAHSQAGTGLTNIEVEYIRQWVMDSAAQFTDNIDTTIINAYYTDTTSGPFSPKLPKPTAGAGLQVRYGPFFLRNIPGQNQVEYMLMNQINFPTGQEVTGMNTQMTSFSHHFILFTFNDSASAFAKATGLRKVNLGVGSTVSPFDGNKSVCSVWVYSQDVVLPTQTAFFWPASTYLDLDFHMLNYSTYPILPFDVYINLTTKTRNISDGVIQMQSRINNNTSLGGPDLYPPYYLNFIPPHTTSRCIDEDQQNKTGASGSLTGNDSMRYIWMLNSHSHKMGVGFNIYNFDNTRSNNLGTDTIYNGFMTYNSNTGVVNQGYYDWEHPPLEYFPNLIGVNYKTGGLICETIYKNDSSFYQTFGFTTAQEMQLFYYLYVTTIPAGYNPPVLGINNIAARSAFDFNIYPNPMAGKGTLAYTLDATAMVNATITDITGKEVAVLKDENEQSGNYDVNITESLPPGMYFAKLTVDGQSYIKKFVVE
jgi:hypothetical protein